MTANEIKTAWNTFKKEIAKEIDIDLTGCCYMNKKQIENGTATIALQLAWSYDDQIAMARRRIEGFKSSDWDDQRERAERLIREKEEEIADLEARKATYGTRENEVRPDAEQIITSAAFKKLAAAIAIQSANLEVNKGLYQIRINY